MGQIKSKWSADDIRNAKKGHLALGSSRPTEANTTVLEILHPEHEEAQRHSETSVNVY